MAEKQEKITYLCKSPSFSLWKLDVTIPCSWYFQKEIIREEESADLLRSLFHEFCHFHHLLGTTYGIYYYIINFTQLIETFVYLKGHIHKGGRVSFPIKGEKGVIPAIRNVSEGFLDQMEQSISADLFKDMKPDTIIDDEIVLGSREEPLYQQGHKTEKMILLHTMFYNLKLNTNQELNIPVGGRAIMENYAKHLECTTGMENSNQINAEWKNHYHYFFLTDFFLKLKEIPDNIKNDLLSCLYYISLMGITPLITNPSDEYFGLFIESEALEAVDTIRLLKPPGLVFYDAIKATEEIAKTSGKKLMDVESFLNELCNKLQLPNIYELNKQLKKLIELCLNKIRKVSYYKLFPFAEYYLEMSLKLTDIILNDPFSFIKGDITKRLTSYFNDREADKKVDKGFMGGYPIPNIVFEHTYDNRGRLKEYTTVGDVGVEQDLLKVTLDIYSQIFSNSNKRLRCYEINHFAVDSDINEVCMKFKDCDSNNGSFDYAQCSKYHIAILNLLFGNYDALMQK